MLKFPEEVTAENFPEAWKYTVSKMRSTKKTAFLRKLSSRTARIVYFLTAGALTFNAVRSIPLPFADGFLAQAPNLCALWDKVAAPCFPAATFDAGMLLRSAMLLYGLPLAAVLVVTLLGTFLYHPLPVKMPEGSLNQARDLWSHARTAEVMNRRDDVAGVGFWAVLYSIVLIFTAAVYLVYAAKANAAAENMVVSIVSLATMAAVYCVAAIAAYMILYIPLRAVIRMLFKTSTPKGFSAQCETYYRRVQLQPTASAAIEKTVSDEENQNKSDNE